MSLRNPDDSIDWSLTTWKGSRASQLRDWAKLSLLEKFRAVEAMEKEGLKAIAQRRARGLPYIDPDSGELVSGAEARRLSTASEEPSPYPETKQRSSGEENDAESAP